METNQRNCMEFLFAPTCSYTYEWTSTSRSNDEEDRHARSFATVLVAVPATFLKRIEGLKKKQRYLTKFNEIVNGSSRSTVLFTKKQCNLVRESWLQPRRKAMRSSRV